MTGTRGVARDGEGAEPSESRSAGASKRGRPTQARQRGRRSQSPLSPSPRFGRRTGRKSPRRVLSAPPAALCPTATVVASSFARHSSAGPLGRETAETLAGPARGLLRRLLGHLPIALRRAVGPTRNDYWPCGRRRSSHRPARSSTTSWSPTLNLFTLTANGTHSKWHYTAGLTGYTTPHSRRTAGVLCIVGKRGGGKGPQGPHELQAKEPWERGRLSQQRARSLRSCQ